MVEIEAISYSKSGKELKQIEPKHATLPDKTTAQLDALQMCRYWLDTYGSELEPFLRMVANAK